MSVEKIGFGGGCHWCTEAVFLSLRGVSLVEQGWINHGADQAFSEAVVVHYDPAVIDLPTLIAVHLHTHSSRSNHSRRNIYRSAIYFFTESQRKCCRQAIADLQKQFSEPLVTAILPFHAFRASEENFQNYYYKNPAKPFCTAHIHPKLKIVLQAFAWQADKEKIEGRSFH